MPVAGGMESHCVSTSIQELKRNGGVQSKKKKKNTTEKPQMMRYNSAARYIHKILTDFSVLYEGK